MKIICLKDQLLNAINTVQKAVSSRSTMPVLDGILFEANEMVTLTGYDMEIGIECTFEADVITEGRIVIAAKMISEIVRKLPDEPVKIEVTNNRTVAIDCGDSHFTIKGMDAETYPKLPEVEMNEHMLINQKEFKDMINKVIFAISSDDSRPILNGCSIKSIGDVIEVVAIDGFRLALRRIKNENSNEDRSFVVPGKSLHEVARIIDNSDIKIEVYRSANHILFSAGKVKLVSRLISGEYMNYNSIIPKNTETSVVINTAHLLDSMERASLVIASEERKVPIRLQSIDDETLVISANTEIGSVREEIKMKMTGNAMDIDFNPKYFIDALKAIDDEEVSVIFNGSMGPCLVNPVEGDDFIYLVLPLRR